MKIIKIIGIVLVILIIALGGYAYFIKSQLTPVYSGSEQVDILMEPSEVYFTEYGIPHIYANDQLDAYRSLGYIHAKERLWQMDLLRHVGSGTLSEMFGPDMIKNDIFLRTMGIGLYAKASSEAYISRNHQSLLVVDAYLEGINAYIQKKPKPLEHTLLSLEIDPFDVTDVFEILTYMAFSFSNGHITDPVLTELTHKLDSSYLQDLNVYHYPEESTLKTFDDRYSKQASETIALLESLGVPEFIGSNSWVISPEKSATGQVILANDPHIGYAQPSVWYESHLIYTENEYYGYHIPGIPFPLLLHSAEKAIGLTMFENDDMDFYVEEIHPEDSNTYKHKGEWKAMDQREEIIQVKGEDQVNLTVRSTVHGPIVSDILKDEPLADAVSMFWVTSNFPNHTLEAIYGFSESKNLSEVEKAASKIHGPGLNIMYGDDEGNVAWWAVGKLPKRRDEQLTKTFYDGSTGLDDIKEVYPFSKNPHAINPPWGFVHSANNQPDTVDGIVYAGYYLPDDRGERILQLLEPDSSVTIEKMKTMLLDDQSVMMKAVKGIMLHAVKDTDRKELLRELLKWDGTFDKQDFRPLIFQKWLHETLALTQKDEIGEDLWDMYKRTHTYKVAAEHLIRNERSLWWDNIESEEVETRQQILQQAFEETINQLSTAWGENPNDWKWGDAHVLNHKHALGDVLGFLNVGPYPISGGNEVLNNVGYTYSEEPELTLRFGPSTRRIVDFSNLRKNSWSILPTGQSGNIFSPYYQDQAELYVKGEFRLMMMDHEEIKKSENKLTLSPN